jgi:FlaA1/EpsC-like NDP-sugar epimerase
VAQRDLPLGVVFVCVGLATVYAVRWLRYRELQLLHSGTLLALTRKPLLAYEFFQVPIDLVLLAGASYLACVTVHGVRLSTEMKENLRDMLPVAVLIKLLILRLSGLYQVRWQYAGMADLLRGLRAIVFGCVAGGMALALLKAQGCSAAVLLLDFFFTATLLLGMRMSLRLLEHYAQTNPTDKQRVLIYGTGYFADMLVRHLLSEGKMAPVGFIHDGSEQRGKTIHGIPILGPIALLPAAAQEHKAATLLVAAPDLPAEQLNKVRAECHHAGVELQQFRVELERMS